MLPIAGVRLGTARAGIKKNGSDDLVVIEIDEGANISGVFTQNAYCAAPVIVSREHLARGDIRFLVINAGNANACTGDRGLKDARAVCQSLAELGGVDYRQVVPFSTGVIGEFLPVDKIRTALPMAKQNATLEGWLDAAKAIMTTDTQAKGATTQFEFDGEVISVSGIAKGAGMIRPNMATMLAYIATDAVVAQPVLDELLKVAADQSFNRITIDGDTSTNDACILIASGQAGLPMLTAAAGEFYEQLRNAVCQVMRRLAQSIIRDGEGATKFVAVQVKGGSDRPECLSVAYSIAHSPLVKTALFASDANWGRIVCAIGYAGVHSLDIGKVSMWLDEVLVVEGGARSAGYSEEQGAAVVAKSEFSIIVDLGRGHAEETVWTSDLSHDYVSINADYRS